MTDSRPPTPPPPIADLIRKAATSFHSASPFVYIYAGRGTSRPATLLLDKSGHKLYGVGTKLTIDGNMPYRIGIGGMTAFLP
jgi:hypothetical protein